MTLRLLAIPRGGLKFRDTNDNRCASFNPLESSPNDMCFKVRLIRVTSYG